MASGAMQSVHSSVPVPPLKPVFGQKTTGFLGLVLSTWSAANDNTQAAPAHAINSASPLSSRDATLYAKVFSAQRAGHIAQADALISQIKDNRLMGHVLAQRYLSKSYKSSYAELKSWMNAYADYPQAEDIYALLQTRGSTKGVDAPRSTGVLASLREPTMRKAQKSKASAQDKSGAKQALRLMHAGKDQQALQKAVEIADRSGSAVPEAGWVAGLMLWKQGEYEKAASYFMQTGTSPYAGGNSAAAGAYWAARSYKATGQRMAAQKALQLAAKETHTFYGLLAAYELRRKPALSWDAPDLTQAREKMLQNLPAGRRAFDLVAAGQYNLAEAELLRLHYRNNPQLKEAALAYASRIGLPALAMRLAGHVNKPNGEHYDSALYPVSPWDPEGGYTVDPSLVHAVIRQESRFDIGAKSGSGARGLMQLMPATAHYIAEISGYEGNQSEMRPEINLRLGQDYLSYLLRNPTVKGDLVSMLVAYNAGPGNLIKWQRREGDSADTLLFIESIPVKETRNYVKHVMTNYWIYRNRAGQPLTSLAALSTGKTARYAHVMAADDIYKLASGY